MTVEELEAENKKLKQQLLCAAQAASILINTVNKFSAQVEMGGANGIYSTYPDNPEAYYPLPYDVMWVVSRHDAAHDLLESLDNEFIQKIYDEHKATQNAS